MFFDARSTEEVILSSGLLLLDLLTSLRLVLPIADEIDDSDAVELVVVLVMTLVAMGKLNKSFAPIGLRGIDNSFVSNGFRNAFGPCCALDVLGCGVVLFGKFAIFCF